jgi:hypothetical protein
MAIEFFLSIVSSPYYYVLFGSSSTIDHHVIVIVIVVMVMTVTVRMLVTASVAVVSYPQPSFLPSFLKFEILSQCMRRTWYAFKTG